MLWTTTTTTSMLTMMLMGAYLYRSHACVQIDKTHTIHKYVRMRKDHIFISSESRNMGMGGSHETRAKSQRTEPYAKVVRIARDDRLYLSFFIDYTWDGGDARTPVYRAHARAGEKKKEKGTGRYRDRRLRFVERPRRLAGSNRPDRCVQKP